MYWRTETPPQLTEAERTSCILHSVQALVGIITYDLTNLATYLDGHDVGALSLPLATGLLARMRQNPSLDDVDRSCTTLLIAVEQDLAQAEIRYVCCHEHRQVIERTAARFTDLAAHLRCRLDELKAGGATLEKWRRISADEIRGGVKRFLHAMSEQANNRYGFRFGKPADKRTYRVDIEVLPEVDGALTLPCMLIDVIRDLVANARKYSEVGTTIKVSIAAEPDSIWLRVSDEGRGILPTDLPYVTAYGRRGENTDSDETVVGGLGLTKARLVATACGGSIAIDSRPGKGTTVELLFPKHALAATPNE